MMEPWGFLLGSGSSCHLPFLDRTLEIAPRAAAVRNLCLNIEVHQRCSVCPAQPRSSVSSQGDPRHPPRGQAGLPYPQCPQLTGQPASALRPSEEAGVCPDTRGSKDARLGVAVSPGPRPARASEDPVGAWSRHFPGA